MEKSINTNSNIELRELEDGNYQIEILVNDYRDSKMLTDMNGNKFIENVPQKVWHRAIENNPNIELYVDHSPYVNVAEKLELDAREDGVYAIATLTSKAKNLYNSIKEHGANGISFGFQCINDSWNGIKRTINKMDLFEISILMTKQPAYNGGYAECRNIEVPYNDIEIKRKRLALYNLI